MHVKPALFAMVTAALALGAGNAVSADAPASIYRASPASIAPLNSKVLPVLVRVNKQGKITYSAPAYELRTRYQQLLRTTLEQMITQPAHDKHGAPIASEFIVYLTGQTAPRKDGKYAFNFTYVAAKPVPFGNWVWAQFANGNLALMSPNAYGPYGNRRPRNIQAGACYYDQHYFEHCVIYTCAYHQTCKDKKPTDGDKNDDGKATATGTGIRAAATRVYRLQHPSVALRTQAHNVRAMRFRMLRAESAQRFQPVQTQAPMPSTQSAPASSGFQHSGVTRGVPREPMRSGANTP